MKPLSLTIKQARRFLLSHQGLWPPYQRNDKSGILDYIHHVGCIQYDPLDIVGQNPALILQSRVSGFTSAMLQDLLYQDRKLIDGLDKNMSIYPVKDWPFFRRHRERALGSSGRSADSIDAVLYKILQLIEERGPISSLDLDFDQVVDWSWAPTRLARAALERMFFQGELIVHHRVHTRKYYDLASRHIPADLLHAPEPNQTKGQYHDWYVHRRIGSVGLLWDKSGDAWLGDPNIKSKERKAALMRLLGKGKIIEVRVQGIDSSLYMRGEDKPRLEQVLESEDPSCQAAVIAPLDNLLWDRRLVEALFDFEYRWEVYVPAAQRRYGYYVLPVLYGDRFVARFEPGRDKQNGMLLIKNWWWEPDVKLSERMISELRACFVRFLDYLELEKFQIENHLEKQESLTWLSSFSI